ncbi:hypothetical protein Dimus_034048 [Dionaea muscipula]
MNVDEPAGLHRAWCCFKCSKLDIFTTISYPNDQMSLSPAGTGSDVDGNLVAEEEVSALPIAGADLNLGKDPPYLRALKAGSGIPAVEQSAGRPTSLFSGAVVSEVRPEKVMMNLEAGIGNHEDSEHGAH